MDESVGKSHRPFWRVTLAIVSWTLLIGGFLLVARTTFNVLESNRLTTDALSWSSGAFLALLIGSLLNSAAKAQKA